MSAPTAKQLAILEWMRAYQLEHAMPPTLHEITEAFGFASIHSAWCHLNALAKKGLVRHRPKVARGWVAMPVEAKTA